MQDQTGGYKPMIDEKPPIGTPTVEDYMKYTWERLEEANPRSNDNEPEPPQHDRIGDPTLEELPRGPAVSFRVTEHSFGDLASRLVEFEREYGLSSVEMFTKYVRGNFDLDEDAMEWLDFFLLYLSTAEVRQFSCL